MARTDKSARMFYHALAALVFAAACAWSAAALYERIEADEPVLAEETPALTPAPAAGRFRGVLLRCEERLPAGAFPGTQAGTRLSAAETGTESALFFPNSDGWASLTPQDADRLTPEKLEELLDSELPEAEAAPRLVYGFTLTCAALFEGDASPLPGPCRLKPDGAEDTIKADLASVTADALGRRMLILRLTEFPEALYELRVVAGEFLP